MKQRSQLSFLQKLFLYCTCPDARKRAHAKYDLKQKAYRARTTFLQTQDDEDRHLFDSDPTILGSSAWLIDHEMTSAFDHGNSSLSEFDHNAFSSSLQTFDTTPGMFDDSFSSSSSPIDHSNPLSDWVTGGTDSTGCHGMNGHHDGFPNDSSNFDSFSSHDPFA